MKLFLINNNYQLAKFLKRNMYGKNCYRYGAGTFLIDETITELINEYKSIKRIVR